MYSTSHLYDILSKIRLYYSRLIQSKACVYKDNVGRDLQYRMGNLCMLIVCCYSWAWEKGKARPLPERIDAIAEIFGVTRADLTEDEAGSSGGALVAECRNKLAYAYGVAPGSVRIMIEV